MLAAFWVWLGLAGGRVVSASLRFVVMECLVQRPAETTRFILVAGLKHKEHSANLEQRRADKRRDAAGDARLVFELGRRRHERQPVEETTCDEDEAADGKKDGYEVGDVPVGVLGGHAVEAVEQGFGGGRVVCQLALVCHGEDMSP